MKQRIRVAAIIMKDNKILLVKHVHPQTGIAIWIPPGGGMEEHDSSIFDCAVRETFEETGINIAASKIVYLREFLDEEFDALNLEIFLLGEILGGELSIDHIYGKGLDEHYIKDVRWFSRQETSQVTVFPEILTNQFWDDYDDQFPSTKYLGRQIGRVENPVKDQPEHTDRK